MSNGHTEKGIVVGNNFNKYQSRNFLVRLIMKSFENNMTDLVLKSNPKTLHEIGCGEGYWVLRWKEAGIDARGSDFSSYVIKLALQNSEHQNSNATFTIRSIYDLDETDSADIIVCSEVLEHLENPQAAMTALQQCVSKYLILSVPNEPIWRLANMARGSYIKQWGNTPGHIQHWSSCAFLNFVKGYFKVIDVRNPFPFTMVLCKKE